MSLKEVIIETAAVAMLAGAFYFAGWAYLSHYFVAFGIDITEVDIPLNTVLVFAFRPLKNIWLLLSLMAWFGLALLYVNQKQTWQQKFPVLWSPAFIFPAAVALTAAFFLVVDWSASSRAQESARNVWIGHRVKPAIPLNSNAGGDTDSYNQCLARHGFVQVFAVPERTYLLCPSEHVSGKGSLYVLDKDRSLISVRRIDRSET